MNMHFAKRLFVSFVAAALAAVASAGPAMARGSLPGPMVRAYNGRWPVTVTGSHGFTGCLILTNSGEASVVIGSQTFSNGSYFIANDTLVATIAAQGYGQNAGLVFIGQAGKKIGDGAYDEVYGGAPFVWGALAFGSKGAC